MRTLIRSSIFGVAVFAASSALPSNAAACGGFFCNRAQPVNQAAEGIIFADNGDGTVTAVIQIRYQGPSQNFSWLLPISSVPKGDKLEVASNLAFQRLQTATNPNYTLNTRVEGTCRQDRFDLAPGGSPSLGVGGSAAAGPAVNGGGVKVEAMGVVGPFDWKVLSVDKSTANPADATIAWLKDNGYDVPSGAPDLLGPYLEDGMYLLALRLTKGADSGSIRPIVLTYDGKEPSIPIKLTAVAANDDMGVLAWVLGNARSVPKNYRSLELNEARINWFNASSNYNQVVIDAANDAGGWGFVTEFAGPSSTLKSQVWTTFDEQNWTTFKSSIYQSFSDFFTRAYGQYGQWDGFWDATSAAVTLPKDVKFEDFKLCPTCYADKITFMPAAYLAQLEDGVITPMRRVQTLIDAHPEITRLYTTLSADEMTIDPAFGFNADLPEVSNQHTADRVIECNPSVSQFEAPWRIELPQGGIIRGTAAGAQSGTWPSSLGSLPPNRVITQVGESGAGKVLEDNSSSIKKMLSAYNDGVVSGIAAGGSPGSSGGSPIGSAGTPSGGSSGSSMAVSGGGCSLGGDRRASGFLLGAAALGLVALRRRRR